MTATRWRWWAGLIALSAALSVADAATGPYLLIAITFVVPVGLAAWHLGFWPAAGLAVSLSLARATWLTWRGLPEFPLEVNLANSAIRVVLMLGEAYLVDLVARRQYRLDARARDSEQQLAAVLDSVADAVVSADAAGRVASWNAAAARMFGRQSAEVAGMPLETALGLTDVTHLVELTAIVSQGATGEIETSLRRPDGRSINAGISAAPMRAADGTFLGGAIVIRDLTERRRLDRTLRAMLDVAVESIVLLDVDGRVLDANHTVRERYGLTASEVVGHHYRDTPWWQRASDLVRQQVERAIGGASAGQHTREELTLRDASGRTLVIDLTVTPIHDDRGAVASMLVEGRNITPLVDATRALATANDDLARAERDLRSTNDRLELVIQGSAAGIWDWNVVTGADYFSDQWERLLGYNASELTPSVETWRDAIHPDDRAVVFAAVDDHLRHRGPYDLEYRMRTKAGDYRWYRATGQAQWDADGRPLRMAGSIIDVTDRRTIEDELRRSLLEKDTLLREVHHRVKNNLAVINSMLFLQDDEADGRSARAVLDECRARIHSIAVVHERLYGAADLAHLDLSEYVRDLVAHLTRTHGVPSGRVQLELAAEAPVLAIDDAVPCGLIVNELVTNALKHGPGRAIVVYLRRGDGDMIELGVTNDAVTDSRCGLEARRDSLGLRLVTALTRQLDGTFAVETSAGQVDARLTWRDRRGRAA